MKKSTKIIVSVLAVVLIAVGIFGYQYIQSMNAKQTALEQEIAQLKAEQEEQQPETQQQEESVSTAEPVAMTDAELEAVFEKVYTGCADAPVTDALFNLTEVLKLQNKTYPSDYEDRYLAWADEKAMADAEAMKDQLDQWANGENLETMGQEGNYVAPDSLDMSTPTENNYTNPETVTTDPDDEINNNFQQSGVDTSYSETEDTGTVPDLSGLGQITLGGGEIDQSDMSVGDLDDTGLVINP